MAYVTPSRCVRRLSAALLSVRASSAKSPKAGLTRQAYFLIFSLWASTACLRLCGGLQRDALGNRFLQALIYIRRDQAGPGHRCLLRLGSPALLTDRSGRRCPCPSVPLGARV
uniref:Putative secreted protein n=1 Tax=Ixodes ricinus TaxID=34613 RepID=A0A6B0UKF2_IXORI